VKIVVMPEAASSGRNSSRSCARDFGAELDDHSLTPGDNPRIAPTRFEDWLSESVAR
jgi:hypothetical protein